MQAQDSVSSLKELLLCEKYAYLAGCERNLKGMDISMEPGAEAPEAGGAGEQTTEEMFLQVHQSVHT